MSRMPAPVAAEADRNRLGVLQRRYPFQPVAQVATLVMLGILLLLSLFIGAILTGVVGVFCLLLAGWALCKRLNRAVYRYEDGLVLTDMFGRISLSWRWSDIDRVESRSETAQVAPGSVSSRHFDFSGVEPGSGFAVSDLEMWTVADLAAHVRSEVRRSRSARLADGQPVRFGVFQICPAALAYIPVEERRSEQGRVDVPWPQISSIAVIDDRITVEISHRPPLSIPVSAVADPELFFQAAASAHRAAGGRQ